MPDTEKHKVEERLKEVEVKFLQYMEKIKEARSQFHEYQFRPKCFRTKIYP
jgi:hypothetical protein